MLPNAWDVASARRFADAGFPALATASAGVTASLGYPDDNVIPADEMLAAVTRITAAVAVPVTADMEAGYGLSEGELVEGLIAAGAAGMNLEDTDHPTGGLVDADEHAAWLAAIKDAGRSAGVDLVLNARVDSFIHGEGEPEQRLEEALRRGRLYRNAGADCVYPIGARGRDALQRLVAELGPINGNAMPGGLSHEDLRQLGVTRVTFGPGLMRAALDAAERELLAFARP